MWVLLRTILWSETTEAIHQRDPDYLVGFTQESARLYSLYMSQYANWTVTGSAITVTFINETGGGASAPHPRTVYVFPTDQQPISLTGSTVNQMNAWPYCKQRCLTALQGSRSYAMIKNYMSTNKLFGLSKTAVNNGTFAYSGSTGTGDPTYQWYWAVGMRKEDTDNMQVDYQVSIVYYVKFWRKLFPPA